MTERKNAVRVILDSCSHRPLFNTMFPNIGESITCFACRQARKVIGFETAWAHAYQKCLDCQWSFENDGKRTKLKFVAVGQRHANAMGHRVQMTHDATVTVIKAQCSTQLPLVEDSELP